MFPEFQIPWLVVACGFSRSLSPRLKFSVSQFSARV